MDGKRDVLGLFARRRSIRKYTSAPVSDGELDLLLEAAMAAPSAHALRPWHFIVVRGRETCEALAETHEYSGMVRHAQAVIVVCSDASRAVHWLEDGCVAAGQILLAASALGLGAVWVAVSPNENYQTYVRGVLAIPPQIGVVCLIPVGHPAEQKAARSRFEAEKVHRERFGG